MRQAGVIAATGLIALKEMRTRLREDHEHAEQLAQGLAKISGITVHPVHKRTNMVFFSVPERIDSAKFIVAMKSKNILLIGGPRFRAVTHYWITPERVDQIVTAVREVVAA